MRNETKKMITMSMLCAISVILVMLIRFPIFPAASFLEYDPADIPIILGTLIYGPLSGIIITVIVSIIQGTTVSAASGPIGIIMHIFATGIFTLTAGLIYKKKTNSRLITALICGIVAWTVSMILWNLILTPVFMGVPRKAVSSMIIPIILPFNLIKAGINAAFSYLLYKLLYKTKLF